MAPFEDCETCEDNEIEPFREPSRVIEKVFIAVALVIVVLAFLLLFFLPAPL